MRTNTKLLVAGVVLAFSVSPALAVPLDIYSVDGPQDPLTIQGPVHELGEPAPLFPPDELISSTYTFTNDTSGFDGNDDPAVPNVLISMTNLTTIYWHDVHYAADPQTIITNFDGWIGNAGLSDAAKAFKIDWVGINRPLVLESGIANTIFEPGETWHFIIQYFGPASGGPPTPFDSIGIAGASAGFPPSTGSIIARPVPEPATLSLLALGGLAVLRRKRR